MTEKNNAERSRMLGEMKMTRLVPRVSVPIMVSMIIQALYNVVDSVFVSRYDPNALTAVSLAFPIQMLMIALSTGMGVGISSLLSRQLGARMSDSARRTVWNGLLVEAAGSLLFMIVGLFFAVPAMHLLVSEGLQDAALIREMGGRYLSIVTTFSLGIFMAILFERMLQSTGSTVTAMITQIAGAVTNIVLDPIMIFGYLGCPRMGVAGAAVATVVGQFVSAIIGFVLNQKHNQELKMARRDFAVDRQILRDIIAVGLPSTVMQAIGSVMNVGLNALLSGFTEYGNAAVNVLSIYFKLQSFVFMPVFGLGSGMIAIVGYNYGARSKARIYSAVRVCLTYALAILGAGLILFQLAPDFLIGIFANDQDAGSVTAQMHALGPAALRVISLCFLPAAVGITLSNVFQAVGKGVFSMIISLSRQLFVLLPAAFVLKEIFGTVSAVWWSFVIAEAVSLVLSVLLYRLCDKKLIRPLSK